LASHAALLIQNRRELRDISLSHFVNDKHPDFNLEVLTQDQELKDIVQRTLNCDVAIIPNFFLFSERIAYFFSMCRLWRFRERTPSHRIRATALIGPTRIAQRYKSANNGSEQGLPRPFSLLVRAFSHYPLYTILERLFLFCAYLERKKFNSLPRLAITAYLGELSGKFDLLVQSLKYSGVKVIAFQSNWDNLSSKNFIYAEPEIFAVWGEQSKAHLEIIQDLSQTNVEIVGSPRFREHKFIREGIHQIEYKRNSRKKIVVFASNGAHFATDLLILKQLNELSPEQFEIYFKPHPFARSKPHFKEFEAAKGFVNVFDDTDYIDFVHLVKDANVLVSQLSTLCLESLILRTPVIIPLFSTTNEFKINYEGAFNYLTHFNGIHTINEVRLARNSDDLIGLISKVVQSQDRFDYRIEWFCKISDFSEELWKLVDSV
jgi:hypothetical protein